MRCMILTLSNTKTENEREHGHRAAYADPGCDYTLISGACLHLVDTGTLSSAYESPFPSWLHGTHPAGRIKGQLHGAFLGAIVAQVYRPRQQGDHRPMCSFCGADKTGRAGPTAAYIQIGPRFRDAIEPGSCGRQTFVQPPRCGSDGYA